MSGGGFLILDNRFKPNCQAENDFSDGKGDSQILDNTSVDNDDKDTKDKHNDHGGRRWPWSSHNNDDNKSDSHHHKDDHSWWPWSSHHHDNNSSSHHHKDDHNSNHMTDFGIMMQHILVEMMEEMMAVEEVVTHR